MTAVEVEAPRFSAPDAGEAPFGARRTAYVLSACLGFAAAAASGLSVAFPSVLTGVPAANGNMRGTSIVVLVVGVPVLTDALLGAARGSARAFVIWVGTLGYLLYQAVMFAFETPLNNLFITYVAYLSLGVWSIVALLRGTDVAAFGRRLSPRVPIRFIAGFALVVVLLNGGAWLAGIVPAVFSDHPRSVLGETGLLTNAVYIQDLAIWLPLLATAAVAAWRRRVWGQLVTGAMLAMFVLESISISVDQWFGSVADPTSSVSSMAMAPAFGAVALLTTLPLAMFLRNVTAALAARTPGLPPADARSSADDRGRSSSARGRAPQPWRYGVRRSPCTEEGGVRRGIRGSPRRYWKYRAGRGRRRGVQVVVAAFDPQRASRLLPSRRASIPAATGKTTE